MLDDASLEPNVFYVLIFKFRCTLGIIGGCRKAPLAFAPVFALELDIEWSSSAEGCGIIHYYMCCSLGVVYYTYGPPNISDEDLI